MGQSTFEERHGKSPSEAMADIHNAMLTTTPEALHEAIMQAVRGWVGSTRPFASYGPGGMQVVVDDLTQHLFGNVVMALRFGADTQEARNAAMYQGMADAKTNRDCSHGYRYGNMYGCPIC